MTYTTEEKMKEEILSEEKTLVVFSAEWCGPCKTMAPLLEKAKSQNSRILKINVDENRDLASQMGIKSIPTSIVFQNGSALDKKVGAMSMDEIRSMLTS
jgi:thioredoxin 1